MTDFDELFFRSIDFFGELIFRETESIVLWSKIWVFKIWFAFIGHVIRFGFHWSRDRGVRQRVSWLQKELFTEREQLICIVIWAYQCTRWNRFKLVCTGLGKIDPAIFRIWGRRLNDYLYKLSRDWSVCSLSHDWSILVNSNFAPPSKATPHDFAVPSYPRDCFVSGSIQLHQT